MFITIPMQNRFVFHTASKVLIKLARIVFISLDKTKIDEVTHEILIWNYNRKW